MPLCMNIYSVFVHIQMRTSAYVHKLCTNAHTSKCTQEYIKKNYYTDNRTHACESKRKETINQTNVARYFEQN